jgi:hypothetical protein
LVPVQKCKQFRVQYRSICEIYGRLPVRKYIKVRPKIFPTLLFTSLDLGSQIRNPGFGMLNKSGSGIQDKHPGSATLIKISVPIQIRIGSEFRGAWIRIGIQAGQISAPPNKIKKGKKIHVLRSLFKSRSLS